jgi:hypothetical protein
VRQANGERAFIEYIKVHRVFAPGLFDPEAAYGDDLLHRLESGLNLTGLWNGNDWRLGALDRHTAGNIDYISFELGWRDEAESFDAPSEYDEDAHQWSEEPSVKPQGAVALVLVDVASHEGALTSMRGEVSVPAVCRALQSILAQTEIQAVADSSGLRPQREWLVDPVIERGSFEQWAARMERVTSVTATFHRPNPRTRDDIQPVVDILYATGGTTSTIGVSNPEGIDPEAHPVVKGAIAMQTFDYGKLRASGVDHEGNADPFNSEEHPASDTHNFDAISEDGQPVQPSRATLLSVLLRYLADRLERRQ